MRRNLFREGFTKSDYQERWLFLARLVGDAGKNSIFYQQHIRLPFGIYAHVYKPGY